VTNGELLELAAKAAGVPKKELSNRYDCWEDRPILIGTAWNPLTDDGQALRLAVKLRLIVEIYDENETVIVRKPWNPDGEVLESLFGDPYAATRRAIVRAAAEIGKNTELAEYKAEIITQDRAQYQAGQEPLLIDWKSETNDPIAEMDAIEAEHAKSYGRFPDAAMGRTVEKVKTMLYGWWSWHKSTVRATLVEADLRPDPNAYPAPQPAPVQHLIDALEKLARLGNADHYGNSVGNDIAQRALADYKFKGEPKR
jgi:hypothetical protein